MQAPPFRLARPQTSASGLPFAAPVREPVPEPASSSAPRRRVPLGDLNPHFHCSVIGTCMTTAELRKLVPKFTTVDRERATELDIHHGAVTIAGKPGAGCKALQKQLDDRHAQTVRRFAAAKDAQALAALWQESVASGDIPGAYWAVMTHPEASAAVREKAFGEVHMLSHLVGAANRADIRRLVALEVENTALRDKVERQQARLQALGEKHGEAVRHADTLQLSVSAYAAREALAKEQADNADARELGMALDRRDAEIARLQARLDAADARSAEGDERERSLRSALGDARDRLDASQAEVEAMERLTIVLQSGDGPRQGMQQAAQAMHALSGKRIVYVGGRPGSNQAVKSVASASGAELVVHDGGVEDRKGLLAAVIANADLVVFPVDCVGHDAMNMLKRVCDRHRVSYYPLRTASLASFIELGTRLGQHPVHAPAGTVDG